MREERHAPTSLNIYLKNPENFIRIFFDQISELSISFKCGVVLNRSIKQFSFGM